MCESLTKLVKIKSSGKKEGKGGIEAFITSIIPNSIENNLILDGEKVSRFNRDPDACLESPILKNNPIEAHP